MKIVFTGLILLGLLACDNSGTVEIKTDSLKKGLEENLDKIGDSAKAKGQRTLDAINDKLDNLGDKGDSLNRDTTRKRSIN